MATFRHKPDKVKYNTVVKTLDETHQQFASNFQRDRLSVPDKISKLVEMKKELELMSKTTDNKISISVNNIVESIKKKSILKTNIQVLEKEIENIKNGRDEIEYYSKTSNILLDYYNLDEDCDDNTINLSGQDFDRSTNQDDDIIEDDKLTKINKINRTSRREKKPTKTRVKVSSEHRPSRTILTFFNNINNNNIVTSDIKTDMYKLPHTNDTETVTIEKIVSNKASLFDEYRTIINKSLGKTDRIRMSIVRFCDNCNIEKMLISSEGHYVCTQCGESERLIIEETPCHKDAVNEKPRTPYKKITHMIETLNQFQAKESVEIPPELCNEIVIELRKNKINKQELSEIKYSKAKLLIKSILKKIQQTDYYEHIPFILSIITEKPPPTISRELEDFIKKLFRMAEVAFLKHCPDGRKNFTSYSFFYHKIFGMLEMPEYADCFTLLKSRSKLKFLDGIWEKICIEYDWPFFPCR